MKGAAFGNDVTLYPASAGVLIEVLARLHAGVHVLEQSGRCVIEKQIISDQEASAEVLRWCKTFVLTGSDTLWGCTDIAVSG